MTLRTAADRLNVAREPIRLTGKLPGTSRTARRETEIAQQFGISGQLRPPPDLTAIYERLVTHLRTNSLTEIQSRDLRYAPQCIWGVETPIADDRDLLARLLRLIEQTGRKSLVRTLAAVYFRYFRNNLAGIELVGQTLTRLVNEDLAVLHKLQVEFAAFDPNEGPAQIAENCLARGITPQAFLRTFGISGEALSRGYGVVVYGQGMIRIAGQLLRDKSKTALNLAIRWTDESSTAPYNGSNQTLANALLLPFANEQPSTELRNSILDVLLTRIGDPRTNAQRWLQMEKASEIAQRWLTQVALQQFLEIVDQVAYPHHWDYRRAFWLALYDMGAISQAWVAFGQMGAERAVRDFGTGIKFGRLQATWKHVERGHAVLVMQIGDYTVVDWSQNGRCVIWPIDDPEAPKLYQDTYSSGQLAPRVAPAGGIEVTHGGSNSYSWQRKIAAFINNKTGYALTDRDYHVT